MQDTKAVSWSGPGHSLVLGGARSGKSHFAETLATQSGLTKLYVATATAWDDEMRTRIERHRADRAGAGWRTIEEPLALVDRLRHEAAPARILLVDCLTLWLTNIMLEGRDPEVEAGALAGALPELAGAVIFVSNEVGWGIVPESALGRAFRDAQGRLNQMLAQRCRRVVLVVAGLPLDLKPHGAERR